MTDTRTEYVCPNGHRFTKTTNKQNPSPEPHFCYQCLKQWETKTTNEIP